MISVRIGTFETNSSSAHCFILAEESEFIDFHNGRTVLYLPNAREARILSWPEAFNIFKSDIDDMIIKHPRFKDMYDHDLNVDFDTSDTNKISIEDFKTVIETECYQTIELFKFYTFSRWEKGTEGERSTFYKNEETGLIEMSTNYRDG